MKIGITRLSGNITDKNSTIIGNFETLKIAELLKRFADVDILTCKECEGCISIDENYDINQYDRLLIVNDSANMFGGVEIATMTTIYKLLAKYDRSITYILTDLNLPFVDYWTTIKNKPWNNYKEEDFKLKHPINIISQGKDIDIARKIHERHNININQIIYVPLNEWGAYLLKPTENFNKTIDLIYGGSFRSGKRENKLIEYYFLNDIKTELYGTIRLSQFKKIPEGSLAPTIGKKVSADKIVDYNSKALATVLIGDKDYQNNMVTLRFIEALLANCICFIDNDFDKEHTLLPDEFYVSSGLELKDKINRLKTDREYYMNLLTIQKSKLNDIINKNMPNYLYNIIESML